MRFSTPFLSLFAATLLLAACDDPAPAPDAATSDAATADATIEPDAAVPDAAAADADVADAEVADANPNVLLTNRTPSCSPHTIFALPAEEGQYAASRLTPPSYPFRVDAVRIQLAALEASCKGSGAHHVLVFRGTDAAPAASPVLDATLSVPAGDPPPLGSRVERLPLDTPITLAAGEHLFVAIEMVGQSPAELCVLACGEDGADDRNYWSNAVAAPFPWATMASFNLDETFLIEAIGRPVP
jgi:hypothetical protein